MTLCRLATTLSSMSTTVTPNIPLLRKVVEWVEEQDQLAEGRVWLQRYWLVRKNKTSPGCGTFMCIAGKVATDAGWKPYWGESSYSISEFGASFSHVVKGSAIRRVSQVAGDLLGLTQTQRINLFYGSNSARTIRRLAEEIAGERL